MSLEFLIFFYIAKMSIYFNSEFRNRIIEWLRANFKKTIKNQQNHFLFLISPPSLSLG
jgi:hypothetical protein